MGILTNAIMAMMVGKLTGEVGGKSIEFAGEEVLKALTERRASRARDILINEISKGKSWKITEDAAAAAIFSYIRAAREGSARSNLELMAQAFVNSAQEGTFSPNEFKRNAESISSLSREEIFMLVHLRKCTDQLGDSIKLHNMLEQLHHAWMHASTTWSYSHQYFGAEGVAAGLCRTGWVVPLSSRMGTFFALTPQFEIIERLVDIEGVSSRVEADPNEFDR